MAKISVKPTDWEPKVTQSDPPPNEAIQVNNEVQTNPPAQ